MARELPTFAELESRVRQSAAAHGGSIPRDVALVWDGYFAALLEWGLISVDEHARLVDLLPSVPNNPVLGVFLGWDREQQ
jgi:hypothetical protein